MSLPDSMFLFEIEVKNLKSNINKKDVVMVVKFDNIFKVIIDNVVAKQEQKCKQKCIVRRRNLSKKNLVHDAQAIQSITVTTRPSLLLTNMKKYPLKLYAFRANDPIKKVGTAKIPWKEVFMKYLKNLMLENIQFNSPPYYKGTYNIYNNDNSECIFTVEVSVKMTHIKNNESCKISDTGIRNGINFKLLSGKSSTVSISRNYKDINIFTLIQSMQDREYKLKRKIKTISDETNEIDKIKNCSSMNNKNNALNNIFGDPKGQYGNQVHCVNYFSVEKDTSHPSSTKSDDDSFKNAKQPRKIFKFKKCDIDCQGKNNLASSSNSNYSLDYLGKGGEIKVKKCKNINCNNKKHREALQPQDTSILLNLANGKKDCCVTNKTEEIAGRMSATMKIGKDPCFCTCECTFGFTKKTTYCNVCGGYEVVGDDLPKKPLQEMPIPCPIYHKLIDKSKLKTWSTSGSESRKRTDDQRSFKTGSAQKAEKHINVSEKKSIESEKDLKKNKKKRKDDLFLFNYDYKAPQIGHSTCALSCLGTLDNVPKNMGWLWTAENVPGIKFRPMWKPGAISKHVVRLLKIAKNPGEMISKKKRKDTGKKKRPLKRPLLVVHKKDGEFTITMETMKNYSKPRALNQHPYEDKPVSTYTIGRSEEENRDRLKKKERVRRRLEKAQREFIQSTFRNMCHEICLKTYQQALGILPGTEDPECICYPEIPTTSTTNMNISCSCSEDNASVSTDTDSDEWIVEFTPPNAFFDPSYKEKKVLKADQSTQYTYLDYRVKLLDRFGNPVPRFFKGPDGKQQCSDLGGFWSPDHKWLEINIDGYIAPDGTWAPNIFLGPNGEQVDAENGKFQAMNGKWLVVGVDGYIDSQGKWKFYPNAIGALKIKRRVKESKKGKQGGKKYDKSESSWSCLGDVSPRKLSKLGIVGHGTDRKLLTTTLQDMLAHGEDVNIPQPKAVFHLPSSKKAKFDRRAKHRICRNDSEKCQHSLPSEKGVVAVDAYGNKIYFKLKSQTNRRPQERLVTITNQGISLSSFHVPCFNSFINSEIMKQQLRKRLLAMAGRNVATQVT